jgi:ferredoxin-NADP reductase
MAEEREGRVARIVEHAADTRSLFLRLSPGERLGFRPGQFVSCLLPLGATPVIKPYSLASDPEDEELELCLNLVPGGAGSRYLFGLAPGATVGFTGPWGTFVLDRAPDAEAVFVADGTGIAAIRPMLRRAAATASRHALRLLHGVAGPALWADELAELARRQPLLTVEHVPSGRLVDEVVRRWVAGDDDRGRHFFVCGVGDVVRTLRDLLRRAGYARRAVQYEKW